MKPSSELSTAGRAYVALVAAVGITLVSHSVVELFSGQLRFQWFVLAGLTLLSGSFTVRVPTIPARLSVSETFVFAAAMLFGPAAATVLVVLDSIVISIWQPRMSRRALKALFNMSAPAVAIWVAAHTFFWIAAIPPLQDAPRPILSLLVPLLAMAVVYFLLNSWLIAAAVAFEKHISALVVWQHNFLWLSLNFFSGASVAALLLPYLQDSEQSFFRVAGILLPLLLISYLTYKTALGRVDDANRHLKELNQLYLSTIETLAMAIDAKDQITHGHIRRVQQYAVGLAKHVGITDPMQIRAIEAASLLHDMGKLAVPEYILNKPGKLTPAEFDRMKLHASVGADILSAINFPYPVVPIVRHHHENWDGTGYPDGLKGDAIPIGARILSVVDCFDALTSDRPYRPRLTDTEALRILLERRSGMYDPLVVDTFIATYNELVATDLHKESKPVERLAWKAVDEAATAPAHPLENITASTEEMLVLYDLARALTAVRAEKVIEVVFKNVRRILPISACVFYEYNSSADALNATHAAGENADLFLGITIPRGQRLSGWVAANNRTILNSDPVLDLGEVARISRPRLRSCISTPVVSGDSLIGVLTAYSVQEEPFGEDHRRIFEGVSRQVSGILRDSHTDQVVAAESSGISRNSMSVYLGSEQDFRLSFERLVGRGPLGLVHIELHGQHVSLVRSSVGAVAGVIRKHLPNPDLLFRLGETGLVAAMPGLKLALVIEVRTEIERALAAREVLAEFGDVSRFTVGLAYAPQDGMTLEALFLTARNRQINVEAVSRKPPAVH